MRRLALLLVLTLVACGEEEPVIRSTLTPAERQAVADEVAGKTGVVHEIVMTGSIQTGFSFQPSTLTIKVGDTVRWVHSTAMPHNIAFYHDQIPQGAQAVIDAIMPAEGKLGSLNGRIMNESGDTFEMDFVNVPLGTYTYFSVVQEALGMVGTLIVEQ